MTAHEYLVKINAEKRAYDRNCQAILDRSALALGLIITTALHWWRWQP